MSSSKLVPISAFQWASVAQYIVYVSRIAGLKEINSNFVISFPLAKIGVERLMTRKRRVLWLLNENLRLMEVFVGNRKDDLGVAEMSVIRGIYRQTKAWVELVEEHIRVAQMYEATEVVNSLSDDKGDDGEFPF